jgi:hypothetical protein
MKNIKKKLYNSIISSDSKGIATVEFIFIVFLMIFLSLSTLNLFETRFQSLTNMEEDIEGRIILEKISNIFNEISSLGPGYQSELKLPNYIADHGYTITIKSDDLVLEFNNKKGKSIIFPINIVNSNNEEVNQIKMVSGNDYIIKNSLDDNNNSVINIYNVN